MRYKAFLFDLNGTMIDDMSYHADAWQDLLNNDLKRNFSRGEVEEQMYGKNSEVLTRLFGKRKFSPMRMDELSYEKEKRYQDAYRPHLALINGLDAFLTKAKEQGIVMAIGSAAVSFNIDFVLDNLHIRDYFKAVVSADDVNVSKPDPETFLKAAHLLQVEPAECIVFEDAPKGVEAAQNAGMKSVVLTTMHPAAKFGAYSSVLAFVKDYTDPALDGLFG
jgi:beta-phosphoglucomutase